VFKKLMWFLFPNASCENFRQLWMNAGSAWRPPPGVARWVRSCGETAEKVYSHTRGVPAAGNMIALEEFWISPETANTVRTALLDSEKGFSPYLSAAVDLEASLLFLTAERTVIDGPRVIGRGITNMPIFRPRPGITREACDQHWFNGHGPLVKEGGSITHYTQCPIEDANTEFHGISITYFPDQDTADQFSKSRAYLDDQVKTDLPRFIDTSSLMRFTFKGDQLEMPIPKR
jgi:hypothetical protein